MGDQTTQTRESGEGWGGKEYQGEEENPEVSLTDTPRMGGQEHWGQGCCVQAA